MGIDPKTLARLVKGERTSQKTAEKVSNNIGIGIDKLFTVDKASTVLSPNTVNHHYDLLSSILSAAVDDDLISKSPQPKAPPTTKTKITYYDDQQIKLLLQAFDGEPITFRVMGYVLVDTGMRRSECAGLAWSNVDLEKGQINVVQQRQHVSQYGGEIIKDPKTESGTRTISLSPTVLAMLKEYQRHQLRNRLRMGTAWVDSDYVFRYDDGKPLCPDRAYHSLQRLTKKHGLPKLTVHGLRHTNATLLIAAETDIVTLSGRLGHADKNVTLNTYSHQIRSKEKEAANKMDLFYNRQTDNNQRGILS